MSTFQKGVTTVNCSAGGGSTTCSLTITVKDMEAPHITSCSSNVTVNTKNVGQCGAVATYPAPTANDNFPGVTWSCVPASGSTFSVGVTTVTCTATDLASNTATCSFTVTVTNIFVLQDDSNGNCLVVRLTACATSSTGTGTYCWNEPNSTKVTGGCTFQILRNSGGVPTSIGFVVNAGDPKYFSGGMDFTGRTGNARLTINKSSPTPSIVDGNIDNSNCTCP